MDRMSWGRTSSTEEVFLRAGARRKYNAERRRLANQRLIGLAHQVAKLGEWENAFVLRRPKPLPRFLIPALAKTLGVDRSTVWRDVQRLRH
jgi:HTH domain